MRVKSATGAGRSAELHFVLSGAEMALLDATCVVREHYLNLQEPHCYVPGRVFLHVRSADEFRALAAKLAPE